MDLTTGHLLTEDLTRWTAGQDLRVRIGTGDLQTRDVLEAQAGRDVDVRIGSGSVQLGDISSWEAVRDHQWQIAQSGQMVMADAQTELLAGRQISLDVADDVRLDWLQSGQTISIRSARGAVLDNTAAETEILATRDLVLDTAHGAGVTFSSSLNTHITGTLTATNRVSGGINLQNWVGFGIGPGSVTNRGLGSIVLIAGGVIEHSETRIQSAASLPRGVVAEPGQKIYLIHNLPGLRLLEHWGNESQVFLDIKVSAPRIEPSDDADLLAARGVQAQVRPVNLIGVQREGEAVDAAARLLLTGQQSAQTLQLSQPIKLADALRESRDGQPRNPFGADWLPEIRSVASEVGGAALLERRGIPTAPAEPVPGSVPAPGSAPASDPANRPGPGLSWFEGQSDPIEQGALTIEDSPLDLQALAARPVLQQAMRWADDKLDLPLFGETFH
jgi:hypothetical protein